jgi:hypothetical protein
MMLTCKEFARLVASGELADLSFWLRVDARVHAWLCRHCRRYRMQIHSLGPAAERAWASSAADSARTDALARRILEGIVQAQRGPGPDGAEPET